MKSKASIAKNNKVRGKRLESDIVTMAKSYGFKAVRSWASNGKSIGEHETVDVKIETNIGKLLFQCKRAKRFLAEIFPTEHVHGQIIRQDSGRPFVVLDFEYFLTTFLKGTENASYRQDKTEPPI